MEENTTQIVDAMHALNKTIFVPFGMEVGGWLLRW